jgi:hypothetical protein
MNLSTNEFTALQIAITTLAACGPGMMILIITRALRSIDRRNEGN